MFAGAAGVVAGGLAPMADSRITWDAPKKVRLLGSVLGELGPRSGEELAQSVYSTLG